MSAIRKFMAQSSGYRPFVFKVDTSLGDGLPEFEVPFRPGNITPFEYSVNGSNYVYNGTTLRFLIPLPANSISTISIKMRRGSVLFNGNEKDKDKIIEIVEFGGFIVSQNQFEGCSNLVVNAIDTPRLAFNQYRSFYGIKKLEAGVLNYWDFSQVENLNTFLYTLQTPFSQDLNISSNYLTILNGAFRNIAGTTESNISIDAPNVTSMREVFRNTSIKGKISANTPLNKSLYYAFNHNVTDECDFSDLDVTSVADTTAWIGQKLRTDYADTMLVNWNNLPSMVSGVDWNLRGTQVTSVGKDAIDSMEAKWGNTFSNYTIL